MKYLLIFAYLAFGLSAFSAQTDDLKLIHVADGIMGWKKAGKSAVEYKR